MSYLNYALLFNWQVHLRGRWWKKVSNIYKEMLRLYNTTSKNSYLMGGWLVGGGGGD